MNKKDMNKNMKYFILLHLIYGFIIIAIFFFIYHKDISSIQSFSGESVSAVVQPKLGAVGPQEIYSSDYKDKQYVKYPIEANSMTTLSVSTYISATTTDYKTIPARKVVKFDTQYLSQGLCLVIKNSNGIGFSYLSVQDGVLSVSINSCE